MFGFEKLEAWQKAVDLADLVYVITRSFPAEERFGLTSQSRRSSVSISGNIAEGSGRGSKKDFARFVEIAYGSLMETVSHMTIACRQGFASQQDYQSFYAEAERLARILSGLRNSLERAQSRGSR